MQLRLKLPAGMHRIFDKGPPYNEGSGYLNLLPLILDACVKELMELLSWRKQDVVCVFAFVCVCTVLVSFF